MSNQNDRQDDKRQGMQAGESQGGATGLGGRGEVDPLEAQELQDGAPGERSGSQNGSTESDVREVIGGETGTRQQGGGSQGEGMGDDSR